MKQTNHTRIRYKAAALALGLLTLLLAAPAPAYSFVDRGRVLTRTLPGGLEVLVRPEPAQKVVELQVWVAAGSRDEPAGKEGIAHLFEHMLFKGTGRRGVGEIAGAVEAAGGDINAYTSMDHTVYHITIAADFLETAMDILGDAVLHSSFDAGELEKEKLVVIEEINRGRDQPSRRFSQELFATAYRVHPYGRKVIGTPGSVSSVTRSDMVRFHRKYYVPGNMKLVVVGGVRPDDVFRLAGEHFKAPSRSVPERVAPAEPPQTEARIFRLTDDTDPARVTLAFPIGRLTDPDTPVLDLLAAVLSEGGSSRLPRLLRDRGLVLSAWGYAYTPMDPGLFILGATAEQDKVPRALEGLLGQLARLQAEPVAKAELERARDQVLTGKIFSRESVEGQAGELGYMALTLGDPGYNDTYYSRLQAVDSRDVMAAARRYFSPRRVSVGFLTRSEEAQPGDDDITAMLDRYLKDLPAPAGGARDLVYRGDLENGITVLVREDHRLPLVSMRVGVLGGSRYETETSQGAFNLVAHLLTRGTGEHTAAQLAEKLDGMSASAGGFSGRNSFGVTGKFLARDAGEGLAVLRELLTGATLPEKELELMRSRVLSGIRARRDALTSHALDLLKATLFTEHPYRFPTMGTEESVNALSRQRLLDVYRSVVRPQGMVISIAGDITAREGYDLAEAHFGDLVGSRYEPGPLRQELSGGAPGTAREERPDKNQTHIFMGYPGPSLADPDLDALTVLNAVLTGQGGRLFTELRDRRSLAYSVFSFVAPGVDPGFIALGIAVSPDREDEAIAALREQVRRVAEEPVTAAELQRARQYLIGSHMIGLQTVAGRADEPFFPVLYGLDLQKSLAYAGRMRAVTAGQVQAAARKWLDPDSFALVVIEGSRSR